MMKIGLKDFWVRVSFLPSRLTPEICSSEICSIIFLVMASVVCAQMSITLLERSPAVMSPSRYWFSTSVTSFCAASMSVYFAGGMIMSLSAMEMPARVAFVYP